LSNGLIGCPTIGYNVLQLKEVGDFLPQMFIRRTDVCLTKKPSYEALIRQFLVGAVM